ncbi:hypothetical protein SAPIO_CDS8009 [Scedosporium apiospermum]|uniref:G domain-containing protein n=1 Tax=Pseudallescheria apiosperma TaxID=563466 RepID=A0A084G0F5_PSEDA|nr:uncharacterized protein SAPIO_CDS8009 [Scedosporium apiospermum]KEZ40817.1 hypothetical protein SAPIO_CDS8009 [Scedosporium apiospermum]
MQDIFSKIEWRKTWKLGSSHDAPELTERSILVAVMGMTGAGKTTFINKVTGANMEIGHGLKSCTKEPEISSIRINGQDLHLIDTPGFDDTEMKDSDILLQIAEYLNTDVRLSGILYLHPITTRRVGGAATRNL